MTVYRVLIVDDQSDVRNVLRAGLETLEYEIEVIDVPSGEEAFLVISQQPIDLLVADIRLPGISGLELTERTRSRNLDLKLILITGVTEPKLRRQVEEAGADAYFFKPVDLTRFLDAVSECLGDVEPTLDQLSQEVNLGEPITLSDRMNSLGQEAEAVSVYLMDERGQVMAQTGNDLDEYITPTFTTSLVETSSAAARISDLVGTKPPGDLFYFPGQNYNFVVTHVGEDKTLMLVVPLAENDDDILLDWMRSLHQGAQDLEELLSDMGPPVGAQPEQLEADPIELDEEIDTSEVMPEIDALFEQSSQGGVKPEDVDSFWDEVVADNGEQMTRSDGISFDQAQELGLTSGEE